MLYSKGPSVFEHPGLFPEISHRSVLLCGREEVNGNESTPVEKENTIDPKKRYPDPAVSTSLAGRTILSGTFDE